MAHKALVDVNVCLDVLLDRKPFVAHSGRIFEEIEAGNIEGVISGISFDTLFYIMRPAVGWKKAVERLRLLMVYFTVGAVDVDTVDNALQAGWKDLEDALQYFCAVLSGCDYVITRNVNHFKPESDTRVLSPEDFVNHHL